MREDIQQLLAEKSHNKEIGELLTKCKQLVKSSRDKMSEYYPAWDFADDVYKGRRKPDAQDKKAAKRGEPQKMILPMTSSQVETFVAFFVRMVSQRQYFYELLPRSDEDVKPAQMGMAVLEHDLAHNMFKGVRLPEFGRHIAKYGLGVLKDSWWHDKKVSKQMVPDPQYQPNPNLPQVAEVPMVEQVTETTKFLGNRVVNITPFNFFPDPGVPLTRFQEGEFCASEEEWSITQLQNLEQDGVIAGIEHVRETFDSDVERRVSFTQASAKDGTAKQGGRFRVVTEVQLVLNPAKTMIAPGVPMDKMLDRNMKCLVWYANDDRIIKIEPDMGYEHDEFTYSVSQYTNDSGEFVNGGLADIIGALQETATWFLNAHVTSVRRVIDNKFLVDPKFIEMQDLIDRKSIIRTKPGASANGMERWFQQLNVQDVTQNHVKDTEFLSGFSKEATGINENLLGQFTSGRRSAREAANVSSNSAARLILVVSGIWDIALVPLGKRMLSNSRQGLDVPQFVRVYGLVRTQADAQSSAMTDPEGLNAVSRFLPVDKTMLAGNCDFEIFDGTTPSQRQANAARLQELLIQLSSNPMAIPLLGFDPQLILNEILELSDVRNVNRLRLTPQRLQQFMLMAGASRNAGGSDGVPTQG